MFTITFSLRYHFAKPDVNKLFKVQGKNKF